MEAAVVGITLFVVGMIWPVLAPLTVMYVWTTDTRRSMTQALSLTLGGSLGAMLVLAGTVEAVR